MIPVWVGMTGSKAVTMRAFAQGCLPGVGSKDGVGPWHCVAGHFPVPQPALSLFRDGGRAEGGPRWLFSPLLLKLF